MTRKSPVTSPETTRISGDVSPPDPRPLEAALGALQLRAEIHREQSFSGDWSFEVPAGRTAVYLVSEGSGWMASDGRPGSPFAEGDVVFNLSGSTLRFGNHSGDAPEHNRLPVGEPAPFCGVRIVAIEVDLIGPVRHPLIGELPSLMRIPRRIADAGTTLGRLAACVISESRANPPAIPLIRDRLAGTLILEALRAALSSNDSIRSRWLEALSDPEVGPVLEAMLRSPERDWSVASLAECGAMSRSTFARRFQALLGCGPMDCLVDIRMRKAGELLARRDVDLKSVARAIGYRSTAAFSASFKRWSGQSPSDYRRENRSV